MSVFVFFAVLGAALLHASWNALIKVGASKVTTMSIMTLVQGLGGLLIALTLEWPAQDIWPWLIATGIFHAAYKVFLAFAYEAGDLSRVYPIARGAAPLIVLIVGSFVLTDTLTTQELIGILVLGLGIVLMGRGVFLSGEARQLVPLALFSAAATAAYTLLDGVGARLAGDATLFVAWLFVFDAVLFLPAITVLRGRAVLRAVPRVWMLGSMAAAASFGAYLIAVWAMTQAPIALVAALRETSILFAVLIGWLAFGERMDRLKGISACLIVSGIAVTRL
ncbi:MAG: DMT family transporter [Boseongicola sp.]|nr:DMT family transporter [Boseongicola sp.]